MTCWSRASSTTVPTGYATGINWPAERLLSDRRNGELAMAHLSILRCSALRRLGLLGAAALALSGEPGLCAPAHHGGSHPSGLGKVLTTKDGGQIYGFDIDQNGDDGVLASAQDSQAGYRVSVETF